VSKRHGLGLGNGKIVEFDDGSAGYIKSGGLTQAFRVQIGDVTGFSVTKSPKFLERQLNVLGNGTMLASVSVNHGTPELIERWFRAHPLFATHATPVAMSEAVSGPPNGLIADELRKLGDLKTEGLLTDEEFLAQKRRLLGS
jgi:Short C-terminal domain